ncbi:MAG TPA: nitroreductase [Ramlibacter sp.]|nr:nitroreductase [Ramlibacter sp.]
MSPAETFAQLLAQRSSIRAYLPTPVADDVLRDILIAARRAPSGANLQPGRFIRVQGEARQQLTHDLIQAFRAGHDEGEDYDYFPKPMTMGLRRRQVAAAQALYESAGIAREERAARDGQFERNFSFFDAPVALVVTIDREFGAGGYMDLGMALYGLMLAAQSHGLATCGIGALASFPNLIRHRLELERSSSIVCGMAVGHADPHAPVNRTRTARCTLDDFFRSVG